MLFPTATFAAYFAVVFTLHVSLRAHVRWWKATMLGASYVFYGWWDWRFCGLLALVTAVSWAAGRLMADRHRRWVLATAVAIDLGVLAGFKYYGFFVESLGQTLGPALTPPLVELVLPVGVSFYVFQAISYVVDVHRREIRPRPLGDVALYLAFFPQLVAGPIVRASEFLPQLSRFGRPAADGALPPIEVSQAAWLIGRGLFKKVVIASYLAEHVVDPVYAAPGAATRTEAILAFYGYAIQIYADFSGYTDMAIGIALLLGFRFPTNFDQPYRATSLQDFWRRWHMTLSRWLRDYLYVPLGGNRRGAIFTYRNLMITMVLGGLWHGAAWNFVLWGLLHGGYLAIERAWTRLRSTDSTSGAGTASGFPVRQWLITLHLVAIAWVPFRAETLDGARTVAWRLVTAPWGDAPSALAVAVIAGAFATQVLPADLGSRLQLIYARIDPALQSLAFGLWLFVVTTLGPDGVAPFIYFQF
ncbi:MAG: MBOAT family protein [Actinomycetota bacterium]